MRDILHTARAIGRSQNLRAIDGLPKLAISVAKAVARGELTDEEIPAVYVNYRKEAQGAEVDLFSPSVRAQISKLRQPAKYVQVHGLAGVNDLIKVVRLARAQGRPLYPAITYVSRRGKHSSRKLTKAEIQELIAKAA